MWLYIPTSALPPASGDSTSELSEDQAARLAQSVMWKQKSRRPEFWRREWRRRPFLTRLFGPTCEPSTLDRGAAKWRASLPDIPASPSPLPAQAAVKDMGIDETSGQMSFASFETAGRDGASSKTSKDTSAWATLIASSPTLKQQASAVRSKSSERLMRACPTSANASSFLPWQTLVANWDRGWSRERSDRTLHFQGQAIWLGERLLEWQTLTAKWDRNQSCADWRVQQGTPQFSGQAIWLAARLESPGLPKIERGAPLPQAIRTSSLRVNPTFGEAVMGLPRDWTSPMGSACRCSATP